ncbi:MAG: hypothetical protein V1834_01690 [Candidatus Micrarchaeota archaeon]
MIRLRFVLSNQKKALILLVLFLALYALTKITVFAYFVFLALVAAVFLDLLQPSKGKQQSNAKMARELVTALVAAVAFWFFLGFVLQTSTPINVITSCSMLPVLDRGDMIILQGGKITVPEASVNLDLSQAVARSFILTDPDTKLALHGLSVPFVGQEPAFNFDVKHCTRGSTEIMCLESVDVNGAKFRPDNANDVIVFVPNPVEYGLLIHRAFLKINAADGVYYMTKGDNNLFPDQLSGIALVPEKDVQGKVLLRVPVLGYLKLFLFLQFEEPEHCRLPVLTS